MNMTNREFKCFTDDVLDLYCRTKISEVESVFIKLANVEPDPFWKWLLKNNRVRQSLINSSVYDALDILSHIRSIFSYGQPIDKSTVVRTLNSNAKNMKTMPVILAMNNLVDNNEVKDILQPYRDIIEMIGSFMSSKDNPLNENDIIQDLNTIKNLYFKSNVQEKTSEEDKVKETIPQKRINMLRYLLTRFSDDIANAAASSGMSELAAAAKSGILAKPFNVGLNKYIKFENFDTSKIKNCERLAEYILKKPQYEFRWGDHNHDTIEMELMKYVGALTKEEMLDIITEYERAVDPMEKLQNEEETMYSGYNLSGRISIDQRLNPDYLLLLSTFFVFLRNKAGLPTGYATKITY